MLFNSYAFLFGFLPLCLLGYYFAAGRGRRAANAWLVVASLAFYGYWRPSLLWLLLASTALNWLAACLIARRIPGTVSSRTWLITAIVLNIAVLGYFKYLFPGLNALFLYTGSAHYVPQVILPLGISFFTFTQIAFLIDLYQGAADLQSPLDYLLFVTFFPHLIAGPLLHHSDIMPQWSEARAPELRGADLAVGFSWFTLGLAKKVVIADRFATVADPVFAAQHLRTADACIGVLAYALQLYFDFSGYSDMALGLARMFSIDFPLNFNSPFKASSVIDFWQRWHMTLTGTITMYLYTPLQKWVRRKRKEAGKSVARADMLRPGLFLSMVAFPMLTTMGIAGVWHGAGLQFLAYGLIHGVYLTVNHLWRLYRAGRSQGAAAHVQMPPVRRVAATLLTFVCVVVSFIFFRANGLRHALTILATALGHHDVQAAPMPGSRIAAAALIGLGLLVVWTFPNTQQILTRFKPSLQAASVQPAARALQWAPSVPWALVLGLVFFAVLVGMRVPSSFLYFQF